MTRHGILTTAMGMVAASLLFAGCASHNGDAGDAATPTATTETTAPTATTETTAPTATTQAAAPVAGIDAAMLLPAAEMPPWTGATVWQEAALEDLVAFPPACGLPTPESLGAVAHFTATYNAGAADDEAVTVPDLEPRMSGSNTIMLFPDEATARAALDTLEAVMPDCLQQDDAQRALISDEGSASSWTGAQDCSFTGSPACGDNEVLFEFVGIGVEANTAAMVAYNLIAQDANYCNDPEICADPRDPVLPEVYTSLERMNTP